MLDAAVTALIALRDVAGPNAKRGLRDAWITLANRCEPFDLPDVTEK